MTRGRDRKLTWPKRIWCFDGESVRGTLMRERFASWDSTQSPALLWRKTTPNKQQATKLYEMVMNWAQVKQEKQQQAQVYVSTIYFYIYAYISTF